MTQMEQKDNIELQREYNSRFEEELYAKGEETAGIAANIGVMKQLVESQAKEIENRIQDSFEATKGTLEDLEDLGRRFHSAMDENMDHEVFSNQVSSYDAMFSKRKIVRQTIHGHGKGINAFTHLSRMGIDYWLSHAFLGMKEEAEMGKALVSEEAKASLFYALYYYQAGKQEQAGSWLERYFRSCDVNDFIVPCDGILSIPFDIDAARLLDDNEVKEKMLQYLEDMDHAAETEYPCLKEHCLHYEAIMDGLRQMEKVSLIGEQEYKESQEGGYDDFLARRDRDEDELLYSLHARMGLDMRMPLMTYEEYIVDGLARLRPFPCLVYGHALLEAVDEFLARHQVPEGVVVKCNGVNVLLAGEEVDLGAMEARYGKLDAKELLRHPLFWMYIVFIIVFAAYAPREHWEMVYAIVFGMAVSIFGIFTLRKDLAEGNGTLLEQSKEIAQKCGEEYQRWQYAYDSASLGKEELEKKVNRYERD